MGINQEFAKRFEHNKKREERQRLEEKYKKSGAGAKDGDADSSSSDESEDDGGYLATEELDAEISAVLNALKSKDPRIYKKDAVFYKPFNPEQAPAVKKAGDKGMSLKDYHRERYMNGDVGAGDEPTQDVKPAFKSMAQRDAELRDKLVAEIKATLAGDDDEDWSGDEAFLKPKEPVEPAPAPAPEMENGLHPSRAAAVTQLTEVDVANADRDPDDYLNKFMATRAWAPGSGLDWKPFNSDDEDEEEKANEFEHAYNMRFEDPDKSNEVLKTYSRDLTASRSVRKEEVTGRKRQRQLEKEKKEAEKRQQNEERARLRRLKLEQASDRLAKIKQAAGMSGRALKDEDWVRFLDEAWDDEKWEEEMQKRFGEEYYAEAEDLSVGESEGESGDEGSSRLKSKKARKPRWDDDIDIKDLVPDFDDEAKPDMDLGDSDAEPAAANESPEEDSEADERPSKKRKTAKDARTERNAHKREARAELATLEALVNKKVELEHPRALASGSGAGQRGGGGGPGFRYRETSPNAFGLTARDILLAPSDAALNEFAGLKKLASFRDAAKKRRDKKRLGKKARLRQWRRDTFGKEFELTGPTYGFEKVVEPDADADGDAHGGGERRGQGQGRRERQAATPETTGTIVEGERMKTKKRKRSKGKRTAGVQAGS